jgi:hypothetical protein
MNAQSRVDQSTVTVGGDCGPTIRIAMLGIVVAVAVSLLIGMSPSTADATTGWWHLSSTSTPSNLPPGGEGEIDIGASDVGDSPANGAASPIVIRDTLPEGLTATAISGTYGLFNRFGDRAGEGEEVVCSRASLSCEFVGEYAAFEHLEVRIRVAVSADAASGTENTALITGGEATGTSIGRPVTVSGAPTPFGVERFEVVPENEGGSVDTQAGSHPFQFTTSIALNQRATPPNASNEVVEAAALPRNLSFRLPATLRLFRNAPNSSS